MAKSPTRIFPSKPFTTGSTLITFANFHIDAHDLNRLTRIAVQMHRDVVLEYRKAFQAVGRRMTRKMRSRVPPEYPDVRAGIQFRTRKLSTRLTLTIQSKSPRSAELEFGGNVVKNIFETTPPIELVDFKPPGVTGKTEPPPSFEDEPLPSFGKMRPKSWQSHWQSFKRWAERIGKSKEAPRIWTSKYGFPPTKKNLTERDKARAKRGPLTEIDLSILGVPPTGTDLGSSAFIPAFAPGMSLKTVTVKTPPRPFFWNTVVEELPPSMRIIEERVTKAVKEVVKRNEKPLVPIRGS